MKKLFSKKSGFTLVEIVIALAVFAIMASMIAQMLNLALRRRRSNVEFEKNLQNQQETLITTKDEHKVYDTTKNKDGTLDLNFGDGTGLSIDYQIRDANGNVGDKSGINYFIANTDYKATTSGSQTEDNNPTNPGDPNNAAGAQTDRFDTRLVGTRGINYIQINSVTKNSDTSYTIEMEVDDSTVQSDKKNYAQLTMFFGMKAVTEGNETVNPPMEIKSLTDAGVSTDFHQQWEKPWFTVRKSGLNGVKVGVTNNSSKYLKGGTVKFTVEFERAPAEEITIDSFGSNSENGKYTTFEYKANNKTYTYDNIYGAYAKTTSGDSNNSNTSDNTSDTSEPTTSEPAADTSTPDETSVPTT